MPTLTEVITGDLRKVVKQDLELVLTKLCILACIRPEDKDKIHQVRDAVEIALTAAKRMRI